MRLPLSNNIFADYIEPLLLYWLVFGQLFLLFRVLDIKMTVTSAGLLITGLPLLLLMIDYAARHTRSRCFHMSLLMVVFAHLGILAGSMMDFGPQGLLILAGLCGSISSLSPELIWFIISSAPWTFTGMLLGSNLGMVFSSRMFQWNSHTGMRDMVVYPVCNIGMLGGMLLMEFFMPLPAITADPHVVVINMLLLMLLGMIIGMLVSWWLVGRLYKLIVTLRFASPEVTT